MGLWGKGQLSIWEFLFYFICLFKILYLEINLDFQKSCEKSSCLYTLHSASPKISNLHHHSTREIKIKIAQYY